MTQIQLLRTARTFLFVPGSRPERFDKAAAAGADVVVLDLEDAVAREDKARAREDIAAWLSAGGSAIIRINAADSEWHNDDVALAAELEAPVMLAKAQTPQEVSAVAERTGAPVIPLVETSAGVLAAADIARQPGVVRLAFGAIDLAAEIGVHQNDREALLFTRSTLVLASAAAGLAPPIDGVTTALRDEAVLVDDVTYAARIGIPAKLCIHPSQVSTVHTCLAPSADDVAWAEKIVGAAQIGGSAVAVDGHMVDAPVVARAERILAAVQQN